MSEAFLAHPGWFSVVTSIACGTLFWSIYLICSTWDKVNVDRENTKRFKQ
jgi:hypothetical protein